MLRKILIIAFFSLWSLQQVSRASLRNNLHVSKQKNLTLYVLRQFHANSLRPESRLYNLKKVGTRVIPVLKEIYKSEAYSFKDRWLALMYFARLGGKRKTFKSLISALINRQWFIRSASAKALGYMKFQRAVPYLIARLDDKSLVVRTSVVDALGIIGSKRAVSPLIKLLDKPSSFYKGRSLWIRRHVVEALMRIGDAKSIKVLISLLDDKDRETVKASLKALPVLTGIKYRGLDFTRSIEQWKTWYASQKLSPARRNQNVSLEIKRKL